MFKIVPYLIIAAAIVCIGYVGSQFYHLRYQVEAVYALLFFSFLTSAAMMFTLRRVEKRSKSALK